MLRYVRVTFTLFAVSVIVLVFLFTSTKSAYAFSYNRSAAVNWALANAAHDNDAAWFTDDCTWFVSLALANGGLPMDGTWSIRGSHGRVPGTETATVSWELVSYLINKGYVSVKPISFSNGGYVTGAQAGDIISYALYGQSAGIDHLAIVVDVQRSWTSQPYPDVSDWGVRPASYTSRGWSWSEKQHHWLKDVYPSATAWLLHFKV